jgi:hypothetical protein
LTKNYSAECRTRRNRRQFCRNSACFTEEKNLGIKFQTISRKRKTLEIPFQTISWRRKPSEFCSEPFLGREKPSEFCSEQFLGREKPTEFHSELFLEEKTSAFCSLPISEEKKPRNSVLNHFQKRKNLGIPFRIIFGREKTSEKITFVSCLVKLHCFAEFHSVPLRPGLQNGLFRNTRNHTE